MKPQNRLIRLPWHKKNASRSIKEVPTAKSVTNWVSPPKIEGERFRSNRVATTSWSAVLLPREIWAIHKLRNDFFWQLNLWFSFELKLKVLFQSQRHLRTKPQLVSSKHVIYSRRGNFQFSNKSSHNERKQQDGVGGSALGIAANLLIIKRVMQQRSRQYLKVGRSANGWRRSCREMKEKVLSARDDLGPWRLPTSAGRRLGRVYRRGKWLCSFGRIVWRWVDVTGILIKEDDTCMIILQHHRCMEGGAWAKIVWESVI